MQDLNGRNKLRPYRLMTICAWLLILLCTALLYFKITLTSDTLFYQDILDDLFRYGGHWSDWRLNADPDYFPDFFLYFTAYWLFKTPTACLFFVTMIQSILVSLSGLWLVKKIRPLISAQAKIVLLLSVAFTSLVAANSYMELYWNYSNTHVSSFLCSLVALGLLMSYLESGKKRALILLIAISIIAIVDDAIFLISFYATALVLLLVFTVGSRFFARLYQYKNRFRWSIAALVLAYPAAIMLNKVITFNNPLSDRIPLTQSAFFGAWRNFINATFNLFMPFNLTIFIFTGLIILGLVHLTFLCLKQFQFFPRSKKWSFEVKFLPIQDEKFAFASFFLALLIPVNVSAIIISGGSQDIWGYRYLMFPIALVMLLTIISLDRLRVFADRSALLLLSMMLALLLGSSLTLLKDLHWLPKPFASTKTGWPFEGGLESERYVPQLVNCLKQIEKTGVKLDSGLALYGFYGRGIAMSLPEKTYINYTTLLPSFWMSNLGIYLRPAHYHINYNFLIVPPDRFTGYANIWQSVGASRGMYYSVSQNYFPTGYKRYLCDNTATEIWVYPDETLNTFFQPKIAQALFLIGKNKAISWLASDLFFDTGSTQGSARIAQPSDKPGYVVYTKSTGAHFGSFSTDALMPGKYRVTLYYSAENKQDAQVIGRWFIGKTFYPFIPIEKKQLIYDEVLPVAKNGVVSAEFTISQWISKTNQVLVWYSGHGQLIVKKIVFERVDYENN